MKIKHQMLIVVAAFFLTACDVPSSAKVDKIETARSDLVKEMSGVWVVPQGGQITLEAEGDQLNFYANGEQKSIHVSGFDKQNSSIDLDVFDHAGKKEIWTLRQQWNEKHDQFKLLLITENGSETFGFVRKLSQGDMDRIKSIKNKIKASAEPENVDQTSSIAGVARIENSSAAATSKNNAAVGQVVQNSAAATASTEPASNPVVEGSGVSCGTDLGCVMQRLDKTKKELNASYSRAAIKLSAEENQKLIVEQKAWISARNDKCGVLVGETPDDAKISIASCLAAENAARTIVMNSL